MNPAAPYVSTGCQFRAACGRTSRRPLLIVAVVAVACFTGVPQAVADNFVISADIYTGSTVGASYFGPNVGFSDARGASVDGGFDAFDYWGYYLTGFGGLTLNRRAEALQSINTYRWVDTFTNNGPGTIVSPTISLYGNYGSDGSELFVFSDGHPFSVVSHDRVGPGASYDPVISAVWGNNSWSLSHTNFSHTPNNFFLETNFGSIAPGQSVSFLFFTLLTRPHNFSSTYDPVGSGTDAAAIAGAQRLITNPVLEGLSQQEIGRIVNFDVSASPVPEPVSLLLLGTGLCGFEARRWLRRSR